MYKQTTIANSHLSDWSIEPIIIIKLGEPKDREIRVTFNYSYIYKDIPSS
jgi:hypothetical protein